MNLDNACGVAAYDGLYCIKSRAWYGCDVWHGRVQGLVVMFGTGGAQGVGYEVFFFFFNLFFFNFLIF
jgi:hypothetical protein